MIQRINPPRPVPAARKAEPAAEPESCDYSTCPFCSSENGQILLHNAGWDVLVAMLREWYDESIRQQRAALAAAWGESEGGC